MSNMKQYMAMAMMSAAMASDSSILQSTVPVPKEGKVIKPISKVIPNGMTEFVYDDGFRCYALNLKNATNKHEKWIKTNEK